MKNENVAKSNGQNVKKSGNRITPEQLQRMFLDIAQRECDETLKSFRDRGPVDYENRLEAFNEDFFGLFDEFNQKRREVKDGYILRILKHLGAYDGRRIRKDRLLTVLRVICFIGRYCDDRNGYAISFKGGSLIIPFDDVFRLERFVRATTRS